MAADIFRTAPIDEMVEPVLEAFAKALEEDELFTYLRWCASEERERKYPDLPPNRKRVRSTSGK